MRAIYANPKLTHVKIEKNLRALKAGKDFWFVLSDI